jgi:hypothetical protein
LAAVFALESLTPEENADYLDHLNRCQLCPQLVLQFRETADLLPYTLDEEATSSGLKNRVLTQARADIEGASPPRQPSSTRAPGAFLRWRWPGWLSPAPAAAIAFLLLVVAGLAGWNIALSGQLNAQNSALGQQSRLLESIALGARLVTVPGTDSAPDAGAVLVLDPELGSAYLIVRGLPQPPAGMEYQVWRIGGEGDAPQGIGTFGVSRPGGQVVTVTADFSGATALGVSLEPAGGSPAPTGDIVLLGEL